MSDRMRDDSPTRRSSPSRSRSPIKRKSRSRSIDKRTNDMDTTETNEGNNLYVANLSYKITETDVEEIFRRYGKILKCELITEPMTKESRGFGFITFEDKRDAEDAVAALNGTELSGRNIRVEIARRARGHAKTPGRYLGPTGGKRNDNRRGRSRSRSRSRGGYKGGDYDRYADRRVDRYDDRKNDRYNERERYDRRRSPPRRSQRRY